MLAWRLALATIGVGNAAANCAAPANEVVAENGRPGAPSSDLAIIGGAGRPGLRPLLGVPSPSEDVVPVREFRRHLD